jgi:predicted RNA binding protein YcfA (HicA-like mRNA interferase family)
MSPAPTIKAGRLQMALLRLGWKIKRATRSHTVLSRPDWPDLVFPFHLRDVLGPRLLTRMAKLSGLKPGDL